jgi:hypothetical protein
MAVLSSLSLGLPFNGNKIRAHCASQSQALSQPVEDDF